MGKAETGLGKFSKCYDVQTITVMKETTLRVCCFCLTLYVFVPRWQLPLDPLEEGRVTRPCNEDLTRASNETTFSNEVSKNEVSKNVQPDI